MIKTLTLFFAFSFVHIYGQTGKLKPKAIVKDTISSAAFMQMLEKSLETFYAEYANSTNYDSIVNALDYDTKEIPDPSDELICQRLAKMNELTPFHLDCNASTISVIRFFNKNRRSFIRIAMGRSKLYFDLYEEALAKYDLPLELKFLSVIESGLRPQIKSPAGALGLWQFMYGTGKMFGLNENSYFDERMDPVKETDAACRYLKRLFDIYGDWNLALASYNAGPGNVNKAIRRSGGKRTYWEVRPFLPRETQGYVPNFIAAAYLMTYYAEHNLTPMEAKIHYAQLDTMCLTTGVHMETISKLIDWDLDEIKYLNPIYKRTYIPLTYPNQCISGPLMKIGKLVSFEDRLYELERITYGGSSSSIIKETKEVEEENLEVSEGNLSYSYHKVKKGETLYQIAQKYKVSSAQIMSWNNLRSAKLTYGKILKIGNNNSAVVSSSQDSIPGMIFYDSLITLNHYVKRNESLEHIATKYKVKVEDIKKWNNLKDNWLNLEQKLLIITTIKVSKPGMILNEEKVNTPVPEEKAKAKATPHYYTIRSGDLFNRVAQKHGLSTAELKKLNPGVNPDRINVGQKLRVK